MIRNLSSLGVKPLFQGLMALLLLIGLVWLTFYVLIALFVIALGAALYVLTRRWLERQGVLSPRYGQRDESADVTVIDAEYREVRSSEERTDDAR